MDNLVKSNVNRLSMTARFITKRNSTMISTLLFIVVFLIPKVSLSESGENNFKTLCSTCHTLSDKVSIGPGLQGISEKRPEEWIIKWVKNSQALIDASDKDAVAIFEEFHKIPMPGFSQLTDDEIKDVIKYINENQQVASESPSVANVETIASNVDMIEKPGIDTNFLYIISILILILGISAFNFKRKANKQNRELGYHSEPHKIPNYSLYLLLYVLIAVGLIYFLVGALGKKSGMIDTLMFIVLPYFCFGVFLIGSIYRYKKRGFQVSSLSSQFLEGKKLFWGSLPFHWGLFILFFGHLIAFLFPSSVLAWNGHPVRLLILEISSFAFGLAALLGLILLIKRRLGEKKLLVVANKMDMVVYTILFTQVLSGLGVAFYVRWGSSWFSSVLTPYLRSIFSFNPEINAVVEMPWLVQIHVISAFLLIGIIPFTRFVHFLVAPFDYAWRRYQVFIWNWNPKYIRISRKYNFGKKPRNH